VNVQDGYNVSVIFKVPNLSLFDVSDDLRSDPFEEKVDDVMHKDF
jgi:hypothetical protein